MKNIAGQRYSGAKNRAEARRSDGNDLWRRDMAHHRMAKIATASYDVARFASRYDLKKLRKAGLLVPGETSGRHECLMYMSGDPYATGVLYQHDPYKRSGEYVRPSYDRAW